MATLTKSTGTVTLSGAVEKVSLPAVYGWVWVKNMSDADMFLGLDDGISAGADGVMRIPAGECGRVQTDGQDSVYLMGTGNALVVAQNYADCPFKVGGKGGEIPDLSAYALKSKYGDTTIDVGRKEGTNVGIRSTAEGQDTTASNACSHAEGSNTVASAVCSHAEGASTVASGAYSHSEGDGTTASGVRSHAGGGSSVASGDYSFAHGKSIQALHDHEVALGQYNNSSSYTLFSIGDGTTDTNRHNAFEITKTSGKLHDKDIATIDVIPDLSAYAKTADVPNIKVNSAVNADTVGGKSASDFKAYQKYAPIYQGNLLDMTEMGTYSCHIGDATNIPPSVQSWCYVTMIKYQIDGYRRYISTPLNGNKNANVLWLATEQQKDSEGNLIWTEIYTSDNKPYVTGSVTVAANSDVCVTNHGFTPSAVIWWDESSSGVAVSFSSTQFTMSLTSTSNRKVYYLIFK